MNEIYNEGTTFRKGVQKIPLSGAFNFIFSQYF